MNSLSIHKSSLAFEVSLLILFSLHCNKINLDAETIIETANSSRILHQYEQNTQTAKDKSVFGSPTFIVGSELFWGDDRLEDAIEWARK